LQFYLGTTTLGRIELNENVIYYKALRIFIFVKILKILDFIKVHLIKYIFLQFYLRENVEKFSSIEVCYNRLDK